VRRHAAELVTQLRDHATGAYYRIVDPTPLAAARPGAVAAAVAGCLALGGGATYCVQQGADPIAALSGLTAPSQRDEKPKPRPKRARVAQAPAAPVATPTVPAPTPTPTPTPVQQQTTPQPTATPTPTPLPATPQDEYEPGSVGASSATAQPAASNSTKPAAAPASGPGEFGGP
jgi:outer membrane biosynthesis protein TonB